MSSGTSVGSRNGGARASAPKNEERLVDPKLSAEAGEAPAEQSLRPPTLEEFIGQRRVVENLEVALEAAQRRGEMLEHLLLSGMPGLGKTTLAQLIATESDAHLVTTSGPALERPTDLAGVLMNLRPKTVLFIDEIHRLRASVEEYLYSAMEDFLIDVVLDQGPDARSLRVPIARFTLVAATTREGLLTMPLRARFGLRERLDPYPPEELERIVLRSATILGVRIEPDAARLLSERARGTPRVVNRFLRRVRDQAQVSDADVIDLAIVERTLERLGVDGFGLEELDRRILRTIVAHEPRAVGLKTIAVSVGEEDDTIEEVYEPFLIRSGYVLKTPQGRRVSDKGLAALGEKPRPRSKSGGHAPGLFGD